MKGFFNRKKKNKQWDEAEELDVINLDETTGWSRLDIAHELKTKKQQNSMETAEELMPQKVSELMKEAGEAESEADGLTELNLEEVTAGEAESEADDLTELNLEEVTAEEAESEVDSLTELNLEEVTAGEAQSKADGLTELDLESEEEELEYLAMNEDEEEEEELEAFTLGDHISDFFARFSAADKIVAATGVCILVLGLVTGGIFFGKQMVKRQVEALAPIGEQLQNVGVIGGDTLVAVADARKAMIEAAQVEEELLKEYEEEELDNEVRVSMKLTSVQRDLKIKFVNSKNGKLIGNVLFEVKITEPGGKSYSKKDEDKDGIIYLTGLEPGSYSVAMVELADMEGYSFSTAQETIKVKENIDYQKIDVSDEIKSESQVNVAQEDTAAKVETEATLTDTVEWVESTKTETGSDSTYIQINKSDIGEPSQKASLSLIRSFYATSATSDAPDKPETETGTPSAPDTAETPNPGGAGTPDSGKPEESKPSESETPDTGKPENPDTDKPETPDTGEAETPKPSEPETPQPPKEVAVTEIILSQTTLSLEEGQTATLTATVKPDDATNKAVSWSSVDSSIAKVDDKGIVTGVKAGNTTITAKAGDKTVSCSVTVTAKAVETRISLDRTSASLKTGETLTLKATVTPEGKTLSWSSSNSGVATVDNGKVTAKAAGETTITVTADGKSATCVIKVSANYDPKMDTTTALKAKDGSQVYYYANGQYIEAKVADYYKYDTFYKKETSSQYKYTGWQNLDGKTYYFDKNGNKVTGEQVIQGAKYTFNSDGSLYTGSGILGIDVSTHNGNIDWQQVKNSGVSYVIIRTGFRGSTKGALVEDAKFRQNIQGATNAGLKVGVYFFTQAVNEVEAVEEASMVLSQIKNYKISYPVFIDVESSGGRADGLDAATRTRVINAFCQTIQNGGYRAGIYANKTWLSQKMNLSALSGYKIWLAQYNSQVTYGGRYDMWQYSDKGRIPGISTNVDMNLSYMNY